MQKIILVALAVSVVLMGIIWVYVGDLIQGDMVNILSMIAAVAILLLTVFVGGKYVNQMKTDKAEGELAEENWDRIGEYKNPIPVGWGLSFIGTIIWGIWYWTAGYPTWAFSQIGQWNDEVNSYNAKYESEWANANKDTLIAMGESLFLVQCAPCHGVDATGIEGKAQDLVNWGKEDSIVKTILNGSKGLNMPLGEMPAGLLDEESAKAVAAYVMAKLSPSKKTKYPALVEQGKALWGTCSSCHGEDGKGMGGMAPDLTSLASAALDNGKKATIGTMPSFKGRLTATQYSALNQYIYSLAE
jgi:cytochrome c oxidase cbb3-type subunit 3